jgi:hypothetical protein
MQLNSIVRAYHSIGKQYLIDMRPMNPRPASPGNGEIEGKRWPHGHITSGHGNGPDGKTNWGEKGNG